MRIDKYKRPETSFLSVERDMETLCGEMAKNERLKRLLYYTSQDPFAEECDIDKLPECRWPLYRGGLGKKTEFIFASGETDVEKAQDMKKKKNEGWNVLSPTSSLFAFQRNVKIVPKLQVDREVLNYIIIGFDNFTGNATNPQFRDNIISFDIICHFDQWNMGNFRLRPYRIAAELDAIFDGKKLSGIGKLEFLGCNQIILNDEFGGLSLMYMADHSDDDKVTNPTQPREEVKYKDYFDVRN